MRAEREGRQRLVHCGVRKRIDHDHAPDDHRNSGDRSGIQRLTKDRDANQGRKDDACAAPDRIGDADWYRLQGMRQQKERAREEQDHKESWREPRELLGLLQEGGANQLADDGCAERTIVEKGGFHDALHGIT